MPETKKPAAPKLTNRGGAGLLSKVKGTVKRAEPDKKVAEKPTSGEKLWEVTPKNQIRCQGEKVKISSLKPDPVNARLHPDRNLAAIKDSLCLYGQVKPIVVRKKGRVVMAGNGTMEAATALGWTEIAVNLVDMTEVEAAGFGLADNRTAELAKWDFEVVARLDKLLQAQGVDPVGWSQDELDVLRMAEWLPPTVSDTQFGAGEDGKQDGKLIYGFTPDQHVPIEQAVLALRERESKSAEELTVEEAVSQICAAWLIAIGGSDA